MDYLDPKKKKAGIRRLYAGYVLTAIAIGLAAWILLQIGNGYYVDKNGDVFQNGLIYVDSRPNNAQIAINGKDQRDATDARLVVPEGTYELTVSADNYRPWRRTFELVGGSVRRITYPKLYPTSLKTDVTQTFNEVPDLVENSSNRRLLLTHKASAPLEFQIYSTDEPLNAPIIFNLNASLLISPNSPATYSVAEWTENAQYVLVARKTAERTEYILLNTSKLDDQRNISRDLSLPADAVVSLRDRVFDHYVVYLPGDRTVRFVDLANPALFGQVVVSGVVKFKSFEQDKILYITPNDTDTTKMHVRLLQSGKTYEIRDVEKSDIYFLDIAKLGRNLVMLAGSKAEKKIMIYRNPAEFIEANRTTIRPVAVTALRVENPQFASFSASASIVMFYGGGEFASHEFEADRSYNFKLDQTYDQSRPLRWMDGARFNFVSGDYVYSADFDGSNIEKLVPARAGFGVYFDRDYNRLYSFLSSKDNSLFQMTVTALLVQ